MKALITKNAVLKLGEDCYQLALQALQRMGKKAEEVEHQELLNAIVDLQRQRQGHSPNA